MSSRSSSNSSNSASVHPNDRPRQRAIRRAEREEGRRQLNSLLDLLRQAASADADQPALTESILLALRQLPALTRIPAALLPLLDQIPRRDINAYLATRPDAPADPSSAAPTVADVSRDPATAIYCVDPDALRRHEAYLRSKVIEGRDGPTCMGCDDFACVRNWSLDSITRNLPRTNLEALAWMEGHGMFARRRCPVHREGTVVWRPARLSPSGKEIAGYFECRCRVEGKPNPCRTRVGLLQPYLSNTSQRVIETSNPIHEVDQSRPDVSSSSDDEASPEVTNDGPMAVETFDGSEEVIRVTNCMTPMLLIYFWALSAMGANRRAKASAMNVSVKVVTRLQRLLAQCAWRHVYFGLPAPMTNLQVDEVYIGKRKYHRGKRARKSGQWFVSVTEVDRRTGHSIRTRWYPVVRRDKQTLVNLVRRHVASSKATVTTAAAPVVDDSEEESLFDSDTSVSFDDEDAHSLIKRSLREEGRRYGRTDNGAPLSVYATPRTNATSPDGPRTNMEAREWIEEHVDATAPLSTISTEDSVSSPDLSQVLSPSSANAWKKAHERQEAALAKKEAADRSRKEKKAAKREAKEAKRKEKEARARREKM